MRSKIWLLAVIFMCGSIAFTSCEEDEKDNPVYETETGTDNPQNNTEREQLLSHIKDDAKQMAENLEFTDLDVTSQAFSRLTELMAKDRSFIKNMQTLLSASMIKTGLPKIKPVESGSELQKMGYLAYLPVDFLTFGIQIVFDGKGNSKLSQAKGLQFIFPATIEGIGTTLYKIAFNYGDTWYEKVTPAQLNNIQHLAFVHRIPDTFTMTLSGLIGNQEVILSKATLNLRIDPLQISAKMNESLYFNLNQDENGLRHINYGMNNGGKELFDLQALMDGNTADVQVSVLNDLMLKGRVNDVAQVTQLMTDVMLRINKKPADPGLDDDVQRLNGMFDFQLSFNGSSYSEPVKLALLGNYNQCEILPALRYATEYYYLPLSYFVDEETIDNLRKVYAAAARPIIETANTSSELFSKISQVFEILYKNSNP